VTPVVLAPGWHLWLNSECLLCPGERLDDLLDPDAIAEMVRAGRAIPSPRPEEQQ